MILYNKGSKGGFMEVLKISDSKLKLMLTKEDMRDFGLVSEHVDYNDSAVRRSFFKILDSVKDSHGFDAEGDKLLIQYYPSRDGGCELFVTKLGILPLEAERAISRSERVTLLRARRAIYKFESSDALLDAVRLISDSSVKTSDLYRADDGGYYLDLVERGAGRGGSISEYVKLLEFSKSIPHTLFPYITEHCERLTEGDAIRQLCEIAL